MTARPTDLPAFLFGPGLVARIADLESLTQTETDEKDDDNHER